MKNKLQNPRKFLLFLLIVALAACTLALTAFAAEEQSASDGTVTTQYGSFTPTAEQTPEAYPFVVFKPDGSVKGLYTNWKSALESAIGVNNSVVYLRADVTRPVGEEHVTSLIAKNVSITVDLNGNVITKADKLLLSNYANSTTPTNTNVTFKNGTFVQRECDTDWRAFFNYDYHSTNHKAAVNMNYTFDNVTFRDERDTVADQKVFIFSISEYDVTVPQLTGEIVYNNCQFYSKGCYIFNAATSKDFNSNIDISIKVNGGKVVDSSGLTKGNLCLLSTFDDSLVFGAYNGNYTEFECPTSLAPTSDILLKDDTGAERILTKKGENGDNTVYELVPVVDGEGVEVTPYTALIGLSGDKLDPTKYPLAVFKRNSNHYTLEGVYSTWKAAADAAVAYNGSVIYFRADVTRPTGESGRDLDGKKIALTVDLNGKTLTKSDTYIFDIYLRGTTTNAHVTFKNGTLTQSSNDGGKSRGFISYNYSAAHTVADANIDFTFENVNFKDERTTARQQFIITVNEGGKGTAGIKKTYGDITLNNCVIYPKANASYIFNAYDDGNNVDLSYTVNGGKIIATQNITLDKLIKINEGKDTVVFGDYNGSYTKFVYPTSVTVSNSIQVTDNFDNLRALAKSGTEGSNAVYVLGELTAYGAIGSEKPASEAPLAVFKDNGNGTYTFTKVYSDWLSATKDARTMNSVVYFRTDITRPVGEAGVDLDGFSTNVTVDLNGKTLTKSDKLLFDIFVDTTTPTNITVTIKNGTLAQQECATDWRAFIQYNYGKEHTGADAVINFTFENLTIKDNRTSHDTGSGFIIATAGGGNNSSGASKIIGTVTYNNCEIHTKGIILFGAKDTQDKIDLSYVVNGGKIVSSKNLKVSNMFAANGPQDSISFGKYDGKYITVELSNSLSIDNTVWNTTEGIECVFVKASADDTTATYKLVPTALLSFAPMSSITLGSELVYNVYIPKSSIVTSFTIDGKIYENPETVTLESGEEYYLVRVNLPASEAARNIVLKVVLTIGGTDYNGTFTMSVLKYSNKVLSSDASEAEKRVVKDVLAYIRAAYTYFDKGATPEIDTILGDYKGTLTVEGETALPTEGIAGATLVLNATPTIRFFIPEGADVSTYTFKQGGRGLEYTVGTAEAEGKTYTTVDISVYAYRMCDTITCYINGVASGTYHINAYYEFAKNDADLKAIVEAFWTYCQSARAYKASVATVEN